MEYLKNCDNCNTDVVIVENELFFSEKQKMETAYCPICNSKIHEGKIDGWYFVQTLKNHENDKDISHRCTYPMP